MKRNRLRGHLGRGRHGHAPALAPVVPEFVAAGPGVADLGPRLEELLADVPWIRALSRHLVRDPDLADEIVLETPIRAGAEGPREAASLRAWLAQVLRNFARAARRSRGRRRRHEQSAAKREGVTLNLSGDHVLDRGIDVASAVLDESLREPGTGPGTGPDSAAGPRLRIVLERRMQLQVELADPSLADHFALLDERGEELTILLRTGTTTCFMTRPPILEGHSHVASVGEGARTVVFYQANAEVGRATIRLTPGEIHVIRR